MILKLLYLPVRSIHVFIVIVYASLHYGLAKLFRAKSFDLGVFYQKNLERLGGTFIKMGQVISVRYDILPAEQCQALAKLQDNVKPFSASKGIRILNKELGGVDSLGINVESEPFAAGSLCQVYRAEAANGSKLAIKVKRPLIEAKMFADIIFLKQVKYFLIISGIGKRLGAYRLVDEVIDVLKNELDFKKEARQIELFFPIGKGMKNLVVPEVHTSMSTNKVLTMDLLEGMPLSEYIALDKEKRAHDDNEICKKIYEIYIRCMFGGGTFHADPHPGNIFIMEDGRIGLVDFGIIGVLGKKMRQKNFNYLLALSKGQTEKSAEIYSSILIANDDSDLESLLSDTKLELDLYLKRVQDPDSGLVEKSSASLYMNSMAFARKYNFTFPQNAFLFYKTLFTLDSVILKLYPDFNAKKQTGKVLGEMTTDKLLDELSFDNVMEKVRKIPEMLAAIPELIVLAKQSAENDNDTKKSNRTRNVINDGTRVLGSVLILSAFLLPILYFTNSTIVLKVNPWAVPAIALLGLFIGLRLKR